MKNETSQTLEGKSIKEMITIYNQINGVSKVFHFNSETQAKRAIFAAQMK